MKRPEWCPYVSMYSLPCEHTCLECLERLEYAKVKNRCVRWKVLE